MTKNTLIVSIDGESTTINLSSCVTAQEINERLGTIGLPVSLPLRVHAMTPQEVEAARLERERIDAADRVALTAWLESLDPKERADSLSMLGLDGYSAHQITLDGLRVLRSMFEVDTW